MSSIHPKHPIFLSNDELRNLDNTNISKKTLTKADRIISKIYFSPSFIFLILSFLIIIFFITKKYVETGITIGITIGIYLFVLPLYFYIKYNINIFSNKNVIRRSVIQRIQIDSNPEFYSQEMSEKRKNSINERRNKIFDIFKFWKKNNKNDTSVLPI